MLVLDASALFALLRRSHKVHLKQLALLAGEGRVTCHVARPTVGANVFKIKKARMQLPMPMRTLGLAAALSTSLPGLAAAFGSPFRALLNRSLYSGMPLVYASLRQVDNIRCLVAVITHSDRSTVA
jgi:hypothetical protein